MSRKIAIITGATSGLGLAYARKLAQMKWDLLVTGRRQLRLDEIKEELENNYSISVETVCVDFNHKEDFELLLDKIQQMSAVNMLINNVGYGNRVGFFESSYQPQEQMINVMINACTQLIHTVVPKMQGQKEAGIINVSSLSAFLPAPLNLVYCASKLYMVEFSECLHVYLKGSGISVQALCPGYIKTNFHDRMGISEERSWLEDRLLWMDAADVVNKSLRALRISKVICIPGFVNRMVYRLSRILPKEFSYWVVAKQTKCVKAENRYAVSMNNV